MAREQQNNAMNASEMGVSAMNISTASASAISASAVSASAASSPAANTSPASSPAPNSPTASFPAASASPTTSSAPAAKAAPKPGTLYGVSVGPGDPELITLKAQRIIEACPVIACVQTKQGNTLALSIAQGACNMAHKEIVKLPFTMERSATTRQENYQQHVHALRRHLAAGKDVALLTLGDISIFSTFTYLQEQLEPDFEVRIIPGVTSFCAAAARTGLRLTEMDTPLHIVPASGMDIEQALDLPGYKVLMKSASQIDEVVHALNQRGLANKCTMVQNCGLENERIYADINDPNRDNSYFTLIFVDGSAKGCEPAT